MNVMRRMGGTMCPYRTNAYNQKYGCIKRDGKFEQAGSNDGTYTSTLSFAGRSVISNISAYGTMVICPNSFNNALYASATGLGFQLRSYKPHSFTCPCCKANPVSQSIWSVRLYQVNPKTGTPSLRISKTFIHCFHNHVTALAESKTLVSVSITGLR